MALSKKQIGMIQAARRRVQALHDEDTWRLFLRNCRSVWRDDDDVPRLTDKFNGNTTFEEVMWRLEGLGGTREPAGHWADTAEVSARRVRYALTQFAEMCLRARLIEDGGFEGFVERMTSGETLGPKTRHISECDLGQALAIKHGFVAWMRREAMKQNIGCPRFSSTD